MSDTQESSGKHMLLYTSEWNEVETFKMLPITESSPYMECIYDRHGAVLVVLSKIPVERPKLLPRLDDDGEIMHTKKSRPSGKHFKEQRFFIKTVQEFYIEKETEITDFIKRFAVNADTFSYEHLLGKIKPQAVEIPKLEVATSPILGENGQPLN